MATFKIPVDAYTTIWDAALAVKELSLAGVTVSWARSQFDHFLKGGSMGYDGTTKVERAHGGSVAGRTYSEYTVPQGWTYDIAAELEASQAAPTPNAAAFMDLLLEKKTMMPKQAAWHKANASRLLVAAKARELLKTRNMTSSDRFGTATKSVYVLARDICSKAIRSKIKLPRQSRKTDFMVEFGKAVAVASNCSGPDAAASVFSGRKAALGAEVLHLEVATKMVLDLTASMSKTTPKMAAFRAALAGTWEDFRNVSKCSEAAIEAFQRETRINDATFYSVSGCVIAVDSDENVHYLNKEDLVKLYKLVKTGTNVLLAIAADATKRDEADYMTPHQVVSMAVRHFQVMLDYGAGPNIAKGYEVQVCKAFKLLYTMYNTWLCGSLASAEFAALEATLADYPGFSKISTRLLEDWKTLSASMGQSVAKLFRACPLLDAPAGLTLIERFATTAKPNKLEPAWAPRLQDSLRSEIVRAWVLTSPAPLPLRDPANPPAWYRAYLRGDKESILASELAAHLAWEGTAADWLETRDLSDPGVWKDSTLGGLEQKRGYERREGQDTVEYVDVVFTPRRSRGAEHR